MRNGGQWASDDRAGKGLPDACVGTRQGGSWPMVLAVIWLGSKDPSFDEAVRRASGALEPNAPLVPGLGSVEAILERTSFGTLTGQLDQLQRVASQEATLLLTGETGTGKTFLARLIHELSPRRQEPFVVVECGGRSASLLESEMFGQVAGASSSAGQQRVGKFTAGGRGTLILDEIHVLPLGVQGKLLRAVDERLYEPLDSNQSLPLQARLIAISPVPLAEEVAAGRFRSDLYYRLNVMEIHLRPLREQRQAIPLLAYQFLSHFAAQGSHPISGLSSEALRALEGYHWPANIRELRNVMERAVALCTGPEIQVADLPEGVRQCLISQESRPERVSPGSPWSTPPDSLGEASPPREAKQILEALRRHDFNRRQAAAELGISRMTLYRKIQKYGLQNSR